MLARLCCALVVVLFFGCSSVNSIQSDKTKEEVERQHALIMNYSSVYFCQNQKWPYDLIDLKEFMAAQPVVSEHEIDWVWAFSSLVRYRTNPLLTVKSYSSNTKGRVTELTSQRAKPNCDAVKS